jgi:hypothetical protein
VGSVGEGSAGKRVSQVGSGGRVRWRCTPWGVARRVAASQASAGRGRIAVEFEGSAGQADGSTAYTWLGARTGVVVRCSRR